MFNLILFIQLSLLSSGPIDQFAWLTGLWEMRSGNEVRYESWELANDTTLLGTGFKIRQADTVVLESLMLVFDKSTYWYIPTVPDQNDGKPVSFRLSSSTEKKFVFENPQHDFPQRIIYELFSLDSPAVATPGDSLFVRVESLSGEGLNFSFVRK